MSSGDTFIVLGKIVRGNSRGDGCVDVDEDVGAPGVVIGVVNESAIPFAIVNHSSRPY